MKRNESFSFFFAFSQMKRAKVAPTALTESRIAAKMKRRMKWAMANPVQYMEQQDRDEELRNSARREAEVEAAQSALLDGYLPLSGGVGYGGTPEWPASTFLLRTSPGYRKGLVRAVANPKYNRNWRVAAQKLLIDVLVSQQEDHEFYRRDAAQFFRPATDSELDALADLRLEAELMAMMDDKGL